MCLIIHRPDGLKIPQDWIDNAMQHNPDGWGIMAARHGKIVTARGLAHGKFRKALKSFGDRELFVHFRNATHGTKSVDNCHPFSILDGGYSVMHNGMIQIDIASNKTRSDTWHWCNRVLAPMLQPSTAITSKPFTNMIELLIGHANKIVILRADGEFTIANRALGVESHGMWLSNSYSVAPPMVKPAAITWDWTTRYTTPSRETRSADVAEDNGLSLEDIAGMEPEDIVEICETFPEEVAQAIREYFAWDSYRNDYR